MTPQSLAQVGVLLAVTAVLVTAEDYTVDWLTLGSGTGISAAGQYTLNGTIGQSAVSRLYSSKFTIEGGCWSIIAAIQEPGAPLLSVRLTETNTVVVSWPITWPGFVLLENPDPNTTNWTEVRLPPSVVVAREDRAEKQIVVPRPIGDRFFRLKAP